MITKQQFANELRACRVQFGLAVVGVTILWGLGFGVVSDLPWLRSHSTARGTIVVVALVLLAVSYAVVAKILYRRHGLVCPSCGDWMGSQSRMLGTGRCPRCKAEVFHES